MVLLKSSNNKIYLALSAMYILDAADGTIYKLNDESTTVKVISHSKIDSSCCYYLPFIILYETNYSSEMFNLIYLSINKRNLKNGIKNVQ